MSKDGKRLMEFIIDKVPKVENESVLKSIALIMADCEVDDNGDERADWIHGIIGQLVANEGLEELKTTYYFLIGLLGEGQVLA